MVASAGAARRTIVPVGTVPKAEIEMLNGPGVESVSPPSSGHRVALRVLADRRRERRQPRRVETLRQRDREQKAERRGALRGEVRRGSRAAPCARRTSGGSSAKKCTPAIRPSVLSTRSSPGGGVIAAIVVEAERSGMRGERLEILRDQAIFGASRSAPAHGALPGARPNSAARNCRASWSRTALTMPVSSRSRKACATSTYSETTTRAGTSPRRRQFEHAGAQHGAQQRLDTLERPARLQRRVDHRIDGLRWSSKHALNHASGRMPPRRGDTASPRPPARSSGFRTRPRCRSAAVAAISIW